MKLDGRYFFLLFLSFLIGIYGLYLINTAYYKKLAVISTISEINFLKEMPFLLDKNKSSKLPLGHENLILENNDNLTLSVFTEIFDNRDSIYDALFILKYKEKELLKLYCLFDARLRK